MGKWARLLPVRVWIRFNPPPWRRGRGPLYSRPQGDPKHGSQSINTRQTATGRANRWAVGPTSGRLAGRKPDPRRRKLHLTCEFLTALRERKTEAPHERRRLDDARFFPTFFFFFFNFHCSFLLSFSSPLSESRVAAAAFVSFLPAWLRNCVQLCGGVCFCLFLRDSCTGNARAVRGHFRRRERPLSASIHCPSGHHPRATLFFPRVLPCLSRAAPALLSLPFPFHTCQNGSR